MNNQNAEQKIISVGYAGLNLINFRKVVQGMNLMVVDIRFSPMSKNHTWDGSNVKRVLGPDNYTHVKSLGNRNYKTPGNIEYVNFPNGIEIVERYLKLGWSVVILCVCPNHDTCHRSHVCKRLAADTGLEITYWTPSDIAEMAAKIEEQSLENPI